MLKSLIKNGNVLIFQLGVIIGVELIEIVTIDEKDSLFATKIHLTLTWRDSRLQLYNVKDDIWQNLKNGFS